MRYGKLVENKNSKQYVEVFLKELHRNEIKEDALIRFFYQNRLQNKPFLEHIPSDFIYKNIDVISHVILFRFPKDITCFLNELASNPFFLEEMKKNHLFLEKIISHCRCGEGRELISFLNKYQEQYPIDLELYRKEVLEVLFSHESMVDKKKNSYLEVLEMVLDEVLQVQNLTINDIKYMTHGGFADIYQIGDFVLKVGEKSHRLEIPSHRNVLRPIFRKYLSDIHLMMEIAPLIPILEKNDYDVCRRLFNTFYKEDIILDDIHPQNIGRYRSVKDKYFKNLYISNESIGFLGENYEEPEEGEYVLIDSDYLEYKETCDIEKCQSKELVYKYIKQYKKGV